jgi:ABC-type Fe3+ transport system permease subunit
MSDSRPGEAGEAAAGAGAGQAADAQRFRRRRRVAVIVWAALVVVVWNVVFDAVVIQSGRDYLTRQALHQQGKGPAVTIPEVMRPAILRGVGLASLAGGAVALLGVLGFWGAGRVRRRPLPLPRAGA